MSKWIVMEGGGNSAETLPIAASNAVLRDNFGRSARGLVEASGFDGIDGIVPVFPTRLLPLYACLYTAELEQR